ncbi:hypothetical protein CBR_g54299 [Chara braunii]|uniref:Uncharacterized protein n=1 Tax=Chara braunii TaxID=69332 RepID=A0A388MC14_CHABU|nr:hypothetical protein CBR_g54299 [Chara braunii]|eukprot:GBG92045.1 hypothetical protein CBR_g54299 [Chara braunii]
MQPKELLPAGDEIVTAATNLNCKAAILDLANPKDCLVWTPTDFDALRKMMTKLCGNNWILIVFAPQKQHKAVMKQLYNWDDAEVLLGTWKRYLAFGTAISKYGNWQFDYKDTMAAVLHAEGGDLRKVTRAPKSEAEIVELNVDEEQFKRCIAKHGGEEGNEREVYGRWERHPKRLQKLCSSFLHEDQGVILIGKSHVGLVWGFLRAGHHVFACDSSLKDISYLTKVIEILGKDARNECTVERQKTAHRPDRDMYHKLGKKRNKMWEYLFQGQPKTPFEHDYIVRKAMAQEAYSGYHKAQVGSFAMFVARCERMKFGGNQAMLMYDGYSKIAKEYDAWNPIESDEETETSDLEIEERVKRMREGMKSVPACNAPSLQEEEVRTKSAGASSPTHDVTDRASFIEHMQTDSLTPIQALENVLIHDNRQGFREKAQSRGNSVNEMRPDDDEDDFAVPNALPKLMPGDNIPDSIAQASEQPYFILDKVPEMTFDKWGHHILWHMDLFEPCIVQGKWMMAVHLTKGWKVRARLDGASWLKLAKSEIIFRVRKENDGADKAAIEEKARLLFECLHSKNRVEYKHGFYDLESSRSYKSINWKIDLPQAGHGVETIRLGCSQIGGESNTQFATSVGEAMSQTTSKIMEATEVPRNVDKFEMERVALCGPHPISTKENSG